MNKSRPLRYHRRTAEVQSSRLFESSARARYFRPRVVLFSTVNLGMRVRTQQYVLVDQTMPMELQTKESTNLRLRLFCAAIQVNWRPVHVFLMTTMS
jgi:hypothetical protein